MPVGSIGILSVFEFYMTVLGVGRDPIGLRAYFRFNALDSQAVNLNTDPVQADFHES